jgi:hypothetical protein
LLKESNLQTVCEVADAVEAIGEAKKIQPNLILLGHWTPKPKWNPVSPLKLSLI